jgi:hypothetical protein
LFFNTISSSSSSSSSCRYNVHRGTFRGKKINLEKPHSGSQNPRIGSCLIIIIIILQTHCW